MSNKLSAQALRNILFDGPWVDDAQLFFGDENLTEIAAKYLRGSSVEETYLETALDWMLDGTDTSLEEYMIVHRQDENANELKRYFERVLLWVENTFPHYRRDLMWGLPWGLYYNKFGKNEYDPYELEMELCQWLVDPRLKNPKGIYLYLLTTKAKN